MTSPGKMRLDDFLREFKATEDIGYEHGKTTPPNLVNPTSFQKHFVTKSIPDFVFQLKRQAETGDGTIYDALLYSSAARCHISSTRLAQSGLAMGPVVMGKGFDQEKALANFYTFLKKSNQEEPPLFEDLGAFAASLHEFYKGLNDTKDYSVAPSKHNIQQARAIINHGPKYLALFYQGILGPITGIVKIRSK